jgi:hypothetical protein
MEERRSPFVENYGELFGKAQSATRCKHGQPIITVVFAEVSAGRTNEPAEGTEVAHRDRSPFFLYCSHGIAG